MFTLLPWLLEQLRGAVFSVRYMLMPMKIFVPIKERVLCFFFNLPVSLQSVRGHSAIVFDGHY